MSARKALEVVKNVEHVLAIELIAAVQALEFSSPLRTTAPLEAVHRLVRTAVPAYEQDRFMSPDIEAACALLQANRVWEAALPWLSAPVAAAATTTTMTAAATTTTMTAAAAAAAK